MSTKVDNIAKLLSPFGLEFEEAQVYLLLLKKGALTALEVNRQTKISRTKVYRILDKLDNKGLVYKKNEELGLKFGANSSTQLEVLIAEKEREVLTLKQTAPMILEQLALLSGSESKKSKIVYYSGEAGLKQAFLNSLEAKERLFLYGFTHFSSVLSPNFLNEFREQVVQKRIYTYQLTPQKKVNFTNRIPEAADAHWECRFLHPHELALEYEFLLYNDVCTVLVPQRDKEDAFCVEITNEHYVRMQKQFFQFAWLHSQKMKIVDERQTLVVEE